jgi:hypothetical protein
MIKAAGRTGMGDPLLILGLSGENVTRLTAGEPIHIPIADVAELGLPPMDILIHYGRTEQAIVDEITGHGIKLRVMDRSKNTTEGSA